MAELLEFHPSYEEHVGCKQGSYFFVSIILLFEEEMLLILNFAHA